MSFRLFQLRDRPSDAELGEMVKSLGYVCMAEKTNEFRPPRKGEWFIAGGIAATARRAIHDMTHPYPIARLRLMKL